MRIGRFTREEVQALKALCEETKTSLPEPAGLRDVIVQATAYDYDLKTFLSHPGSLRNAIVHGMVYDDSCETFVGGIPVGPGSAAAGVTVVEPLVPTTRGPERGGAPAPLGDDDRGVIHVNPRRSILREWLETAPTPVVPTAPPAAPAPWLDSVAFFIPRSIREPFLGDLREDLAEMAAQGRSKTAVRWAAVSQVVVLVLRWAWSQGLARWFSFLGGG